MLKGIAHALHYFQIQNLVLVHDDLKPANILLDKVSKYNKTFLMYVISTIFTVILKFIKISNIHLMFIQLDIIWPEKKKS